MDGWVDGWISGGIDELVVAVFARLVFVGYSRFNAVVVVVVGVVAIVVVAVDFIRLQLQLSQFRRSHFDGFIILFLEL